MPIAATSSSWSSSPSGKTPTRNVPTRSSPRSAPTSATRSTALNGAEDEAAGQLFADDQQRQRRRDIEAMNRRLDELDDEEAREIAAITDRYADVKPHTTAAAVVFALTRDDAEGWVELMARPDAERSRTQRSERAELHRAWLELVDTEGPFLAIPPLKRVWPQGMPDFRRRTDRFDALVDARKDFEAAWEALDRDPDNDAVLDAYRVARDKWVETVLRDVAGWAESCMGRRSPGVAGPVAQPRCHCHRPGGAHRCRRHRRARARRRPDRLAAPDPERPVGRNAGRPRSRRCCARTRSSIGIVTDGRWWGLVCAREGAMAASGIVDALTWIEEPRTRDAFLTLIGRQHIIGGDPAERLPVLFEESVAAAEEITEALGAQVRRAVELLIQSFSESAADAERRGLPDPLPARTHDTYEAAVTVMMRVGVPALRRGTRAAALRRAVRAGLRHRSTSSTASSRARPRRAKRRSTPRR